MPSTPRKHKSGAQKRKERKARESQQQKSNQGSPLVSAYGWGSMSGYTEASYQWDPNGPPVELPIYGQPPPTLIRALSGVMLQLEQGVFYQAAYLWDGMLRDDRVAATLNVRIDRLIGSPCVITPASGDEATTQEEQVAKDCEKQLRKMLPPYQLYELMRYALGLSVGLGQVLTTRDTKSTKPTIEVWNPRYLRYDWMLRQFRLVTENKGEITIEQDDPEWILYQPFGPRGWLHGALMRPIMLPWVIRYWVRNWWARYQEVHGQPMRAGVIPADRQPSDEKKFLSQLSNLAHEAVIRLPQGLEGNHFDLKLIEAQANNWEGFHKLLEHCDDSIAIALLGQRQSTMGQGGLGAQDDAGESTLMRLTRKDAITLGDTVREKVFEPWAEANYGDPELAPTIDWQSDPPEDEMQAAQTDFHVSQALTNFKTASAPVDVRAYLEERGYPLLSPEEHAKQQADAQAQAMEIARSKGPTQPPGKQGDGQANEGGGQPTGDSNSSA